MKNTRKLITFLFCLSFLVGCASNNAMSVPDWIHNPDRDQAVGQCGAHALGKYKQQECAMTRARLELAARKGIEIKSMSLMTENANNLRSSSSLNQTTTQEINSKIKVRLVDSHYDNMQDIIWVLVEEN